MPLYIFDDAPDYKERLARPYTLPKATLKQINDAVPKWAHERKTFTSLYYVARAFFWCAVFYTYATYIPTLVNLAEPLGPRVQFWAKWAMWANYWWWQGLVGGAFWTLAHEAGHSTLSNHMWVNHAIGYTLHNLVLVPYYGWRYSHNLHHKATASIERDENFCPTTRSDWKLPAPEATQPNDYAEAFDEVPIVTLLRLVIQQGLGLQAYFAVNALGNKSYPAGTNHYTPSNPLFRRDDASKVSVMLSNLGLLTVSSALAYYAHQTSFTNLVKMYFVPYFITNHWIVLLVCLQHTDPTLPHFRKGAWTFLRGATATVDRPLLGWMGRYFLHNISHDHVAHHFFSRIPFYHAPVVTKAIKEVLGDDYCYDSTNSIRSLYRTFTQCIFVEDEGDVVFYRNKRGKAHRHLDGSASPVDKADEEVVA